MPVTHFVIIGASAGNVSRDKRLLLKEKQNATCGLVTNGAWAGKSSSDKRLLLKGNTACSLVTVSAWAGNVSRDREVLFEKKQHGEVQDSSWYSNLSLPPRERASVPSDDKRCAR
jgi:hypothetical protein